MPRTPEVVILPSAIRDTAATLRDRATDLGEEVSHILAPLSDEDGSRSFGVDPRNVPAGQVAVRHETAVAAMRELANSLGQRMTNLGELATASEAQFVAQDDGSATEIARTE